MYVIILNPVFCSNDTFTPMQMSPLHLREESSSEVLSGKAEERGKLAMLAG
jgi:hypothetical protein